MLGKTEGEQKNIRTSAGTPTPSTSHPLNIQRVNSCYLAPNLRFSPASAHLKCSSLNSTCMPHMSSPRKDRGNACGMDELT